MVLERGPVLSRPGPRPALLRQIDKYQTLCMVSSKRSREERRDETTAQSQPRRHDRHPRPRRPAGRTLRRRPVLLRPSGHVRRQIPPRAGRRSCERPVTAEPARVISVPNPWAWRIVTGLQVVVERPWKPSWRGLLWIHTSKDRDLSAPAELWPRGGQLVSSAIIGHVTLANVEGRPGAWRWVLTDPHQLAEPVTRVHGHAGLWLIDLPPRLSAARNAPRPTWPPRPPAGPELLTYIHACWLFALIGIDMAFISTQRKQHATSPLPDYRVRQAGCDHPRSIRRPLPRIRRREYRTDWRAGPSSPVWRAEPHPGSRPRADGIDPHR